MDFVYCHCRNSGLISPKSTNRRDDAATRLRSGRVREPLSRRTVLDTGVAGASQLVPDDARSEVPLVTAGIGAATRFGR